jgi:hypothetical protein
VSVWVLEASQNDVDCEGLAFEGLFSTREGALKTLERDLIGPELFAQITWESNSTGDWWEGHNACHTRCYALFTADVDGEAVDD